MAIKSARRLEKLPQYVFVAIAKKIAEMRSAGHDVIALHIGSPDMPPPEHVIAALSSSAGEITHHGYAGYTGTPGLRKAIAQYYSERFNVTVDPSTEVLPLIGSKEGLVHLSMAYLDSGDIALVPDPSYPTYAMSAILAGAEAHSYPLAADSNFMPDLEGIPDDVLSRARMLWVSYPNNPTGVVASVGDYAKMVEFADRHNLLLCSDNPYSDVTFDGVRAPSVFEADGAMDVAVEFNTLSKTYNMAGWRVGMFVGNQDTVKALLKVKSNVDSGLFRAVCDAAEVAIRETPRSWIED